MPPSVAVKGIIGAGTVGTVATGVAYVGGFFSNERVKEEINREESVLTLLKTSNPEKRLITASGGSDSKWIEVWKQYKKDNASKGKGEDVWSLEDWTTPSGSVIDNNDAAPISFVNSCKSKSSKKTFGVNSDLYQRVLKYCTRDTLVSDLISENGGGRKLLTSASSTEDWKEAWNAYKKQNKVASKNVDEWGFSDWGDKKEKDELPTDYQKKCSEHSVEPAFKTTDVKYLNVLNWCSK